MRVRAKHWLNHNGTWYRGGEVFEIPTTEAEMLKEHIEIAETPLFFAAEEESENRTAVESEAPKKRGRPKKTAE